MGMTPERRARRRGRGAALGAQGDRGAPVMRTFDRVIVVVSYVAIWGAIVWSALR